MLNLSAQDVNILVSAASNAVVPSAAVTVLDLYMREVRLYHWGWLNIVLHGQTTFSLLNFSVLK